MRRYLIPAVLTGLVLDLLVVGLLFVVTPDPSTYLKLGGRVKQEASGRGAAQGLCASVSRHERALLSRLVREGAGAQAATQPQAWHDVETVLLQRRACEALAQEVARGEVVGTREYPPVRSLR